MDASLLNDTGLEVTDIVGNEAYAARHKTPRHGPLQMEAMQRIAHAFVENPEAILQELVDSALALCGADSAGISIEIKNGTEKEFYRWVATAGQYSGFLHATLPRYPSACGICLERGRPQHFLVNQRFFDVLGVEAPLVTDGILLPWEVDGTRGTIFVMAHGRTEAFDGDDCRIVKVLGDFAAMGVRQQAQQELLLDKTKEAAAADMANDLAHMINNPLQGLTNVLYLASEDPNSSETKEVARHALQELERVSSLVKQLLALPYVQDR